MDDRDITRSLFAEAKRFSLGHPESAPVEMER